MKIAARIIGFLLNLGVHVLPQRIGRWAFQLFCTPRGVSINAKQSAYLEPAYYRDVDFEGKKIRAYKWGDGPHRVLLLHGWASHSYHWKRFIEAWDLQRFTLVALDAPAHGDSEGRLMNVPMYSRLIEQAMVDLLPFEVIVAHSIGCFATMNLLSEHQPASMRGVVLISPSGSALEWVEIMQREMGLSDKVVDQMLTYFESIYAHDLSRYDTQRYAPLMNLPGLLLHDTDDPVVPPVHAERIHAAWPRSELILTSGSGHDMRSDEVIAQVRAYVDRLCEVE